MAKNIRYYKGRYFQGNLSDDEAEAILTLINEYDSVQSLRHSITNAPDYVITDIKNDAEGYIKENGSLEGFKDTNKTVYDVGVGTLRDEQTLGVAFMYYAKSALLGDEVGLGKTVQIAGLYNVLSKEFQQRGQEFRCLFLTEKSSAGQIRDKMIQFTGEYVALLESGEKNVVARYLSENKGKRFCSYVGCHSLMTNPEFLTHTAKMPFDLVVIDESSIAKKATNEFHQNCKILFKYHKRKILLNATPIELELREMYNQLDLLDPNFMPTVTEFNKRYCKVKKTLYGFAPNGYKNEDEFKEAIKLRYLARTRQGLGAEYSDNRYKTILIPLSKAQKALMKKTTMYKMVVDYPMGVNRDIPYNEETTPKLAALFSLIDESVGVFRNQALVYCNFVKAQEEICNMLTEKGYRVVVLNGKSRSTVRTEIVRDFNNGLYDIMITNVLRGIDLKTCDNCILYTIDPNPQKMVQFEGRITREFDVLGKNVALLVAMGKEKKFVEGVLKLRVNASASFTNTGNSMVISAIKDEDNKEMFQANLQYSPEDDEDE